MFFQSASKSIFPPILCTQQGDFSPMPTILFSSPVFGPVHSRRLGLSLGVNLLPADGKLCTFDCLYCECGLNAEHRPKSDMPSRVVVAEKLEERIRLLAREGRPVDAITFAGNGEPTMHPDFAAIVDDTVAIRDRLAPSAKLCVLTNSTNLMKPEVAAALRRFDLPMFKLDALDADWVRRVNRPQCPYRQATLIEALKGWQGECVVQTMFLRGTVEGVSVDNTTDDFVEPWMRAVAEIRPKYVSIYSLDREASCRTLLKADSERLLAIGERVKALGIPVQVSVKPSEVRREKECG